MSGVGASWTLFALVGGSSGKVGASSIIADDEVDSAGRSGSFSSIVGELISNRFWSKSGSMEPKSSTSSFPSSMSRSDEGPADGGPADQRPNPKDVAGGDLLPVFGDPTAWPNPTEARAEPLGNGR